MEKRLSDNELVAGMKQGEESQFLELVERYTQKVFNLAMRITRNSQDAEEILQDVFVTVHQKIDRFEGKSAFSSWLYRITANTSFMKLRKRRQHQAISIEDVSPAIRETWVGTSCEANDINYLSARHELRGELEQAVATLPEEYRLIFVLRDVDGLSNQEVGDIMKLSVPAIKSRLHRSRLMLRKKLRRYYDDYLSNDIISVGANSPQCELVQ